MKNTFIVVLGLMVLTPVVGDGSRLNAKPASSCTALAALVLNDRNVTAATAVITPPAPATAAAASRPASGPTPAYCQVNLTQKEAINIRIGLPLSAADGGTGGVQGAWNGRIENLGGGGYVGNVGAVTAPVAAGYVGSSTDTGHGAAWCNAINPKSEQANSQPNCGLGNGGFVLDANNKLIASRVEDFIRNAVHAQTLWALSLTRTYYGVEAARNYWNGCSTGGRQGFEMAQSYGDLFDGILAGAPAFNWNRFIIGGNWPPIATKDIVGSAGVPQAKSDAANAAAVAACDAKDGVVDGLISEPRRCEFNARVLVCTGDPGDPSTCLTPKEAETINRIWDGPRDPNGQRLWGGLTRGSSFGTLLPGGTNPSALMQTYVQNWLHEDPAYDWRQITTSGFTSEFRQSEQKFRTLAATDDPNLDKVKKRGGKIIHYHGLNDPLIVPFGSYNYVSRVFDRYGVADAQRFMRSFYYPGNAHCGGGTGPQIDRDDLFNTLVQWVEKNAAPDYIVAKQKLADGAIRTRKICKYPDEARYVGSGSINDQNNFTCVVQRKEPEDLKADSAVTPR